MTQPDPDGQIIHGEQGWQFGRIVDPVKAAALHEAVQFSPIRWGGDGELEIGDILRVAEIFERWLAGTDETTT